ncbi:uncharacterized protein LOC142323622 isoform X2 [Lycorma delicatula]
MAHKVDSKCPARIDAENVIEKLIFKPQDIITIEANDVDLEFATKDTFQTDTAISKFNGQVGERELEPWDSSGCNGDDFELDGATANGWDVNDMFKKNEQMYGVTSTFDHTMPGYTMQLQKRDTKDYKDAEAKATKIANEIENNPTYKARIEIENGDEEEKFAAVIRPGGSGENNGTDNAKYVPPAKRKSHQTGKPGRTVQAPPPATNSVPAQKPPAPVYNQYHHTVAGNAAVASPPMYPPQPAIAEQTPAVAQTPPPAPSASTPTAVNSANFPCLPRDNREQRVNGQVDPSPPPKPQRPVTNNTLRSGRAYNINENNSGTTNAKYDMPPSQQGSQPRTGTATILIPPGGAAPPPPSAENKLPPNQMIQPPPHQHHPSLPLQTPHGPSHHPLPAPFPTSTNATPTQTPTLTPTTTSPAPPPPTLPIVNQHQLEQRKSPLSNENQNVNTNPMPSVAPANSARMPRPVRGRDEQQQINELRKFSSDFKLVPGTSESNEEQKKSAINTQQTEPEQREVEISTPVTKEQTTPDVDKMATTLKKSNLNPNAKEFVYNPNSKPFTARSPSTPTPSRPHTPQTPSYGPGPGGPAAAATAAAAIPMVMPATYPTLVVTTAQPAYNATPNQGTRYRKVPMTMPHRPDIAAQMQVAAATGQPLLAPAPMHTQFTMPYSTQGHIAPQPYQQMVRMVAQQSSGMVPLVSTSLNYHHDSPTPQAPQIQYMSPAGMAPPHPHHPHHHTHPPPNTAPSPGQSGGQTPQGPPGHSGGHNAGSGYHHTPQSPANSYPQPPPPPPQGPHPPNGPPTHTFPIMCPILPAPPPPPGPHNPHMMAAAAAQGTMQQYLHHHPHHQHPQVGSQQPHHIQVIIPHSQ